MTSSPSPPPSHLGGRTLLDVIRDEDPHGSLFGYKDKKSWKAFTDRLRLKRARAAWTSSVPIPSSDIPFCNSKNNVTLSSSRSLMSRRNSVRFVTVSSVTPNDRTEDSNTDMTPSLNIAPPLLNRRVSSQFATATPDSLEADIHAVADLPPASSFSPQMVGHDSPHEEVSEECEEDREGTESLAMVLAEEDDRAEARMSLMDLLEETDRKMGLGGSTYTGGEQEDDDELGAEQRCCVCMVRHKGAALIPCGHTFCRLCSRELWVQRGNCPLCNAFILEILNIF